MASALQHEPRTTTYLCRGVSAINRIVCCRQLLGEHAAQVQAILPDERIPEPQTRCLQREAFTLKLNIKASKSEEDAGLVAQIFYHPSNRGQTPEIGGGDLVFRHYQPVLVL